jgi:hypothetical protein
VTLADRLAAKTGRAPRVAAADAAPAAGDATVVVVEATGPVDLDALERRWTEGTGLPVAWRGGSPVRPEGPSPPSHRPVLVLGGEDVRGLLAAGAEGLRLDPVVEIPPGGGDGGGLPDLAGRRIAVVTYELVGLTGTGGIGTAYTALSRALAAAGGHVDVLFTGWADPGRSLEGRRDEEAAHGVHLHWLDPDADERVLAPSVHARRGHAAYVWLRDREPYAVVHVPETAGHGAAIVQARRLGACAALADTTVVVGTHGASAWVRDLNGEPFAAPDLLVLDALERRTAELGDVVVSPSRYLVDDTEGRGWRLPGPHLRAAVRDAARPRRTGRAASAPPSARVSSCSSAARRFARASCSSSTRSTRSSGRSAAATST